MQREKLFEQNARIYYVDYKKLTVTNGIYLFYKNVDNPMHVIYEDKGISSNMIKKFVLPFHDDIDISKYVFDSKIKAYDALIDFEYENLNSHQDKIDKLKKEKKLNSRLFKDGQIVYRVDTAGVYNNYCSEYVYTFKNNKHRFSYECDGEVKGYFEFDFGTNNPITSLFKLSVEEVCKQIIDNEYEKARFIQEEVSNMFMNSNLDINLRNKLDKYLVNKFSVGINNE